ncbi:MAG TPA: hypothetical protein VGK19_16745 [Capsulimonadaceae bacterium]|jgi:hypothetical protein
MNTRLHTVVASLITTVLIAVLALLQPAARAADAASSVQSENHALLVVPVPGAVKIDGDLKDWDLSGEILSCYDTTALLAKYSARTAAMYDSQYLYLSFHVKSPRPMANLNDPVATPSDGWKNGDCIQLRMYIDPDKPYGAPAGGRILHVDAYYSALRSRPVARIIYQDMARHEPAEADIANAVGSGVDEAFTRDADGKGYTQELRIAWKMLRRDGSAFKAGDSFRMGLEFLWGNPSNTWPEHRYADLLNAKKPMREFFWTANDAWGEVKFMSHGKLGVSPSAQLQDSIAKAIERKYATDGVVPITYKLPSAQAVTLVVEKPDGTRVRNLIGDFPRKSGANTDYWDGLDDNGKLVEAGKYIVRGLRHGAYDLLYQFSYGSPGNPPWQTADHKGSWMSDYAGDNSPKGVATDGDWVFLSTAQSEAGTTVIGVDSTGQRQWGVERIAGGPLAVQGDSLYMLYGGANSADKYAKNDVMIVKLDKRTGQYVKFTSGEPRALVAHFTEARQLPPTKSKAAMIGTGITDITYSGYIAHGIAASADKLYVSLYYDNKVIVLDRASGAVTGELPLDHPIGLATGKDGTLYAVSGRQVVKLGTDGKFAPVVQSGLSAPVGLTIGGDGSLYVSDWANQMCVKVFATDGRLQRTIGTPGGRPWKGKYDAGGMLLPWGIAVDAKNRLWTAEFDDQPKRISVWSAAGTLEREFCGPTGYQTCGAGVDVDDPTHGFLSGAYIDLDWNKGQWRVASTLSRPMDPAALFAPRGAESDRGFKTATINGRKLLYYCLIPGDFGVSALENGAARPLMARGLLQEVVRRADTPSEFRVLGSAQAAPELSWVTDWLKTVTTADRTGTDKKIFDRLSTERVMYIWTDSNGDGLVQAPEVRLFLPKDVAGLRCGDYWPCGVDKALTQYSETYRWPIHEWNSVGAPVYRLEDVTAFTTQPNFANAWVTSDGIGVSVGNPFTLVDRNGKLIATYPSRWPGVHGSHSAPQDMNGRLIGTNFVIGTSKQPGDLGDLICIAGNMGKAFLFTSDGLYAGSLLRDCRNAPDALPANAVRGMSIASTSAGSEWFGGEFFRNKLDNKVYLGSAAGGTAVLLSEVRGLDSIERIPASTLTFTPEQFAKAQSRKAAADAVVANETGVLAVRPLAPPPANVPPKTDEFAWGGGQSASWSFDDRRSAEAAWTFDGTNLHLCFRNVKDSSPMVNDGKVITQLFKTGDAALFELRPTPGDTRPALLPGDLRLLVSVFQGKPVVILYRYKALAKEPLQPVDFTIGVGFTHVDVLKVLDTAKVAIDRKAGSYDIRVTVPLADLGFRPEPGKLYRGDFGIVYGDAAGSIDELRMNWHNKDTGLVADLPGEARIEPAKWGTFTIEEPK